MKLFEIEYDNEKILRKLPKSWKSRSNDLNNKVYGNYEIAEYCRKLFDSLLGIKKYDEQKFNKNNSWTIDEYIQIFNSIYKQIFDTLIDKNMAKAYFNMQKNPSNDFDRYKKFYIFSFTKTYNKSAFVFEKDTDEKEVIGFSSKAYKAIEPLFKKLFMLEKMCAFTTRKFWRDELTKFEDLDLSKKYKILVKVVFKKNWRTQKLTKKLKNYYNERIYQSASLIDPKNKNKIFTFHTLNENYALLLMDYDDNTYVCSSPDDDYSEEQIDGKNPIITQAKYTDLFLQDVEIVDGKVHKLYADTVECLTPNVVLHNTKMFSEVNLKNAKPIAVISPNKSNLCFASQKAKELNLPLLQFDK